jgi:hypothetical protein
MALSLYDASIPVYSHMLKNLAAILDKAEAHAKAAGVDPATYLAARIAPDMHPLTNQIQLASDAAKGGAARLAGIAPPSMPDTETTWAEVKERIAKTLAFIESVDRAKIEGGDDNRIIELPTPNRTLTFTARDFLLLFSLPNFHFHVVTAYALLRSQGVPLGKLDYLAGAQQLQPA